MPFRERNKSRLPLLVRWMDRSSNPFFKETVMRIVALLSLPLGLIFLLAAPGTGQQQKDNRTFMRAKLKYSQEIVEGLALENFDQIAKNAQQLSLLSQATNWEVFQTEEYVVQSREFLRAADALRDQAKEEKHRRCRTGLLRCHDEVRELPQVCPDNSNGKARSLILDPDNSQRNLAMNVAAISPQKLLEIVNRGTAIDLVDVRTPAEYREAHVQFARNVPLDQLNPKSLMREMDGSPSRPLYIVCRSGSRGRQACEKFLKDGFSNVINVEGGTLACDQAGFTIVRGAKTISLERQVRIAAGLLVLFGSLLAWLLHPAFIALSAFVGAGLTFSGITDTCGMGMLLARMPWNRAELLPDCATPLRATHTGHTQPCD